ncbi:hypothetical protein IAD21_04412 [Abditibacteriota bacterium]|nr:hypothetical protein IAD21_04412 [Abditibacteriota bacterium]
MAGAVQAQTIWHQDFAGRGMASGETKFESWKPETTAKVGNGALHLLSGAAKENNGVLFAPTIQRCAWVQTDFEMRIGGADGAGLVFLDAAQPAGSKDYQRFSEWDEPNIARGFGIGFDTLNPPETDPFNKNGNIDNQPEREISLHWNVIERLNRRSETEFRAQNATEGFTPIRVRLEWVTGGVNVSVWVRGNAVYDSVFLAGINPMDLRMGLGARSEKEKGFCDIRNFRFTSGPTIPAPAAPLMVPSINREPITLTNAKVGSLTELPKRNRRYGRIIAHLTLGPVTPAIDPWDRLGKVYIYDDKGERFELIRFISSYGRAMDWEVDVSDFRPLLMGKKRLEIECVTYSAGWTASLSFDFYPGPASEYAYRVVNLWNGEVEIGNPKKPVSDFWKPRVLQRPKDADSVVIRITTTGHGGEPNTNNAAEFMPLERTLTVGTTKYPNLLWKTDVYLNPLRPQGGTWKYDRAGWAPGSIVDPWKTDVSSVVARGQSVPVNYDIAPYTNENAGKGNPPFYQFEATAIFYRKDP